MRYTELKCTHCNISFMRINKEARRTKTPYCSRKCSAKSNLDKMKPVRKSAVDFPLSERWPIALQFRVHNRKKVWCIDYKGGECEVCGYSTHPSALEFHHLDPEIKSFEIGVSKNTISKEILAEELDKCALLCANCHREVHAGVLVLTNRAIKV